MAHWPRRGGRSGRTSTRVRPAAPASCSARADHQLGHVGPYPGRAQIGDDGHGLAGQVVGSESGLPTADGGEGERITLVEAVDGVEEAGRVAHRAGEAAEDRGQGLDAGPGTLGDPAVGGLQAEEAAEAGRDADRAAAVGAGGDGQQSPGHGRRRSPRRTARGAGEVPGIPGRAVELGGGAVDAAELRRPWSGRPGWPRSDGAGRSRSGPRWPGGPGRSARPRCRASPPPARAPSPRRGRRRRGG